MTICGRSPQWSPGLQGQSPWWGIEKAPLKLKTVELADTQRRGKSEKFWKFWTRNLAQNEVDSTLILFVPHSGFYAGLKTSTFAKIL